MGSLGGPIVIASNWLSNVVTCIAIATEVSPALGAVFHSDDWRDIHSRHPVPRRSIASRQMLTTDSL